MTAISKSKKILLYVFAGMMELTWLYTLTCILFLIFGAPPFPIWAAILAFFSPMLIISILKGRGRMIIEHIAIHAFFFILILLYTLYFYGNWNSSFLGFQWLQMIFNHQYENLDGFIFILIPFWFSVIWVSGYKLSHRPNDYSMITSRFDLGIVMLVSSFIILGASKISFPHSNTLIIYYFLFSMSAISIAKNISSSKKDKFYHLSRASLILPFILIVLLFGSWILLFLLPQMTIAAQSGYEVLKIIGRPLGILFIKILSFLFGFGNRAINVGPSSQPGSQDMPLIENYEPTWLAKLLQWLMTWGFIIILGIIVIIVIIWLLWFLYKWFSTKTDLDTKRKGFFEEMFLSFINLFNLGKKYIFKIICALKKRHINQGTYFFFKKLCNWGKMSGIPRKASKTPQEYGKHLIHFFPDKQSEIQLIVDGFNREIYGNKLTQKDQLINIKKAWQNLASPLKWPLRLWVRVFVSKKQNIIT